MDREFSFHRACLGGKIEKVKRLLDEGMDSSTKFNYLVELIQCDVDHPIQVAVSRGWVELVELLLERGCDTSVLTVTKPHYNLIELSVICDHLEVFKKLIEKDIEYDKEKMRELFLLEREKYFEFIEEFEKMRNIKPAKG